MSKKLIVTVDVIIVVAFLAAALVYFTHAANQLPHWFPGYSASDKATHLKHGLAAVVVAVGAAAFGWFATGPKEAEASGAKASHHHDSVPKH